MLACKGQLIAGKPVQDELERLVIDLSGLREVEPVGAGLERRHPTSNAEFEPATAHLIEHADFLDQA